MVIKKNVKKICIYSLRVIALTATVLAAIVMATSHEKAKVLGIPFQAKYNDTPALKYFVIANVIASIYGFLVLFVPLDNSLCRFVVIPDMVVILLLVSSISASLAIGHVGKKGNLNAGWLPICRQFHKYCDQVTAALLTGFIGLLIYFSLLLYSFYSLLLFP